MALLAAVKVTGDDQQNPLSSSPDLPQERRPKYVNINFALVWSRHNQ